MTSMEQQDVERLHSAAKLYPVHTPELDDAGEVPMITLGGVHVSVYLRLDEHGTPWMRLSVDLDEVEQELLPDGDALPTELLIGGQRVWWDR
ncbi:hypothetical protein [Streptomyces subrutilus]|uniref:Uncharacterized protein n=1 Tax=Streptomyces subrutilus TaxID=36818 RepID=A0A1E5NXR1_9ACTN|nr:hypothetical protein [Streptomyces subrutilus]OEJ20912.1 hypothetical protein BGK67_35345 [Streptomyces subrutilus]